MAIDDVLKMTLDVSATTDNFVKEMQAAAKSTNLQFDVKDPMIRSFKEAHTSVKSLFANTIAEGAQAGLGRARLDKFVNKLQPLTDRIESSMKKVFEQEVKIRKGGMDAMAKKQAETTLSLEKEKLRSLNGRLRLEKTAADRLIKRRKDAMHEAQRLSARSLSEAGEEFGESVGKAFADLRSGNVGGLLKGAGKRMGATGSRLNTAGVTRGGAGGSAMKGIGGLLSKLGPAVMAIGSIAAGIAAVVAVIIQADSAVKDLNKTLMTAGLSGADLVNQYGRLGDTLDDISQGFMESFAFNNIWGTTAKDHLEILGAYATAGVTLKEMRSGASDASTQMEILKNHTAAALTYSKLLGLSTTEISESMGSYMSDLGFTLEGVMTKYSNITSAAKESGFATKRFFNMVLQATTGMTMYNVRLEEAAGLLIQLGSVLGEKMGGDFLQSLTKGFKDEDTTTRLVKTMTTGVGLSLRILKKDALKTSQELVDKLNDLAKTNSEAATQFNRVLSEFKLKGLDSAQMLSKLATMGDADRKEMLAKATALNPALGRMLSHLARQSVVQGGGRGAIQAAREGAGAGASLLLQMNELAAVTGKRIDQIRADDIVSRTAFEKITGKTGEEFRKLAAVASDYAGRQKALADAQEEIALLRRRGNLGGAEAAAKKFNEAFGQQFGVLLSSSGQRFAAQLDSSGGLDVFASLMGRALGDSFEDLVMGAGGGLSGGARQVNEDLRMAQEIAANTSEMTKVLEQGVEYLLSKIYASVKYIASFFGMPKLSYQGRRAKYNAGETLQSSITGHRKEASRQAREVSRLKRGLSGQTGADRERTLAQIRAREGAIATLTGQGNMQERQLGALGRIDSPDQLKGSQASSRSFLAAAFAQISPQSARSGSSTGMASPAALLGKLYLGDKADKDRRSRSEMSEEERQKQAQTKDFLSGLERIQGDHEAKRLAALMQSLGVAGSPSSLVAQARSLRDSGTVPQNIRNLDRRVIDPATGQSRRLGDILAGSGLAGSGTGSLVGSSAQGLSSAPMHDAIFQVGSDGRLKFAQRIDSADTVTAIASKAGGAIDSASKSSRGGGGGVTIVQHNYADMEGIKKGYRALMAARALG